jgi:type 2 lantibiotic biosynthesis protein LanM
VEFVTAAECESSDQVRRFYQRQGAYLALLYLLQATDLHYENLIAAGEHPVLIDLEALFRPTLFPRADGGDDPALAKLGDSVLLSGLLPQRVFGGNDGTGIDLSGLNGHAGQLSNHTGLQWRGLGTDQMHAVRDRVAVPDRQNRPRLQGHEIDLLEYADDVTAGFEWMYRLLLRERDALHRDWLPGFATDEIRLIVRPTNGYARLLQDATHPDLLRDAAQRDRFMSLLWAATERQPILGRLVPAEIDDLWNGDVPMFTTRPGSRDVFDSAGTCIPGLLLESGLQRVEARLAEMSETDLSQQSWIVRASLATVPPRDDDRYWRPSPPTSANHDASPERLLRAARTAGDRLAELAVAGRDGTGWLCLAVHGADGASRVTSAGIDLYDGLPGIILALAYLGDVTGDAAYTTLARSALPTLRRTTAAFAHELTRVGAFNGWGSLAYLYAHLYSVWGDDDLLIEAEHATSRIAALVDHDEVLDIVGGAAGAALASLSLHSATGSAGALDAARRCAERLVARTPAADDLAAWASARGGRPHLAGFSHGAAGIASSLSAVAAATGDEAYRAAARAWVAHERRLFCAEHQNWPDLRQSAAADHPCQRATWCHGAAGIGLARAAGLPCADDPGARAEIEIAARTTIDRGFGLNHSLCHGDLGNLELLLTVAQIDGGHLHRESLRRHTAMTLDSLERGYAAGTPLGVDTPGLMTGIAGMAYQLLRLAAPNQVPSILALGTPRPAGIKAGASRTATPPTRGARA